ncbi:PAS domain-containing protein [Sphaerochaeta sp. PS]|uniref:PAS domain-containing protein n=1 Tax=Sphaerochaeta sp. PS TaxID=3076336 RepID=UPI0028A46917|nr:PAS domain-containing protein [Sphaerochaeta sp. PS]MDT4762756.1 PAS domain-containing protein [Sphaerochaeta sp. PS]
MNQSLQEMPRINRLVEYLHLLIAKKAGKPEFQAYESDLKGTNPFEVNEALDRVLSSAVDVEGLSVPVSQFIRAVSQALEAFSKPTYPEDHLLHSLNLENIALQEFSGQMQSLSLQIQKKEKDGVVGIAMLKRRIAETDLLALHYQRLQNELFPLFERAEAHHSCVKLMWALQDRTLALRKALLKEGDVSLQEFWKTFGQFYFHVQILHYREQQILFPVVYESLVAEQKLPSPLPSSFFVSPTGTLDSEVLQQIFTLLPLDIAFIDKDDRVCFYSDPPHRIFPRSPQVIGRLVQNCHPPKSVGTVEKILTSFKEGSEDSAEFYLTLQGRFVHIEYFAVRDRNNLYLGTLEVTQDATHLRSLVGQKRLL